MERKGLFEGRFVTIKLNYEPQPVQNESYNCPSKTQFAELGRNLEPIRLGQKRVPKCVKGLVKLESYT